MMRFSHILAILLAGFGSNLAATPLAADVDNALAEIDLMPGWRLENGNQMAAIRITLADGWKTYWRSPGDAGIPPAFEWTSSEPLDIISLSWPTPEIYTLAGLTTYVYTGEVIIPVEIGRNNGFDGPVEINLSAHLGICKDVCVPATAQGSATLTATTVPDEMINASLSRQPKQHSGKASCSVAAISDGIQVAAEIKLPPLAKIEHAVIEHKNRSIWVSQTSLSRDGNRLMLEADLVAPGAEPFSLVRSDLSFTIFGNDEAVEIAGCLAG